MKKKTVITRQVTTVDDVTGKIIGQRTERVVQTDSEEEGEEITDERQVVQINGTGEPDGLMIMNDKRTGKTYKVNIRNNQMKAKDIFKIKDPKGKGLTIDMS